MKFLNALILINVGGSRHSLVRVASFFIFEIKLENMMADQGGRLGLVEPVQHTRVNTNAPASVVHPTPPLYTWDYCVSLVLFITWRPRNEVNASSSSAVFPTPSSPTKYTAFGATAILPILLRTLAACKAGGGNINGYM